MRVPFLVFVILVTAFLGLVHKIFGAVRLTAATAHPPVAANRAAATASTQAAMK